jgi:glycopeptide antibiotics resistance protein
MKGVGKVAYDRYWSRTVVIDVYFSFYLAAILDLILFPFRLTPAEKLVIDLSISIGAANITVLLIKDH